MLVAQVDILETMTPLEFLTFRNRLAAASGFQSDQFRQLEFVLGQQVATGDRAIRRRHPRPQCARGPLGGAHALGRVSPVPEARGLCGPGDAARSRRDGADRAVTGDPAVLIELYRKDPRNSELCERLVDLDEGMQEWRYRHVKMVERTIGMKPGTGGSAGAQYLRTTLAKPAFPDLWEIRGAL